MDSLQYLHTKEKIKDNTKGQKIAAALYLISNHLSDNDPLKNSLRSHGVTLTTTEHEGQKRVAIRAIETLLGTAVLAGLMSEKNVSIIYLELRHYAVQLTTESDPISSLFSPVLESTLPSSQNLSYKTNPVKSFTNQVAYQKNIQTNESKSKRQDAILSFINERKSVGIKDIAALFSDTSEKTIQRELGALVAAGKINKRGEKRWSIYLSVN